MQRRAQGQRPVSRERVNLINNSLPNGVPQPNSGLGMYAARPASATSKHKNAHPETLNQGVRHLLQ